MKFKNLLPLAFAALPFIASARPASPELAKMTNPDGSVVELYFRGNADFSYAMSADGSTLMEKNNEGFWVPVSRNGRTLSPSLNNLELLRSELPGAHLNILPTGCGQHYQKQSDFHSFDNYMAALDSSGRTTFPTDAPDIHGLVVLIEFADTPFSVANPNEAFTNMCNKKGYDAYGSVGSAKDYFEANSKGKFSPTFDVYGPVKVSNTAEYYTGRNTNLPGAGKNARFGYAIKEALELLDDEIDFSKYDFDEDGKIDNIFFFYAGFGQADSHLEGTIWPHQADWIRYTYDFTLGLPKQFFDGVEFTCYACSNELNYPRTTADTPWLDGIGAFCHEFCHVLGLPDHYDVNGGNTKVPGYWDLMSNGSYNNNSTCPPYLNAMERWLVRWEEYVEAEDENEYVLTSPSKGTGNCVRLSIPRPLGGSYNEYYVLESRHKSGWDEFLPGEAGMLIWHIEYNNGNWAQNTVNTNGKSCVELIYSNETAKIPAFPGNGATFINHVYPKGNVALNPRIKSDLFNPYITNITYDAETGEAKFEYNMIQEPMQEIPTGLQVSIPEDGSRNIKFTWDDMEGVEYYIVTFSYTSAAGYEQFIGGYNNTTVKTNSLDVRNVNQKAWDANCTIKITPFSRVPGANSLTYKFVPAGVTAINEVADFDAATIKGGNGFIEAPEGAEIFTLSGVRSAADNLPAGIYLVRYAGKTVKVLVK